MSGNKTSGRYQSKAAREIAEFIDTHDEFMAKMESKGYENTFGWLLEYLKLYHKHNDPDGYLHTDSSQNASKEEP